MITVICMIGMMIWTQTKLASVRAQTLSIEPARATAAAAPKAEMIASSDNDMFIFSLTRMCYHL